MSLSNVSIVSDKPASRNFNTIAKLPKISGHKFEHKTVVIWQKQKKKTDGDGQSARRKYLIHLYKSRPCSRWAGTGL